jgi:hypothetical protein
MYRTRAGDDEWNLRTFWRGLFGYIFARWDPRVDGQLRQDLKLWDATTGALLRTVKGTRTGSRRLRSRPTAPKCSRQLRQDAKAVERSDGAVAAYLRGAHGRGLLCCLLARRHPCAVGKLRQYGEARMHRGCAHPAQLHGGGDQRTHAHVRIDIAAAVGNHIPPWRR